MEGSLAIAYLGALIVLLGAVGALIIRQILKNRSLESVITKLQPKLQKEKGAPEEHYELGSVYLRKKLYVKAISEFNKALKASESGIPQVNNAIGFAYFSQEQYDLAIKNYKEAIALDPEYVGAINNLGHAYERKKLIPQAIAAYEDALKLEPDNKTAKRRLDALVKRVSPGS
ncbi:Tetratricopeptide TPR_1 repeat-containing protein [Thalassoporum mexicanum PCC 7367]|uniref:tetratricopeptide repeat protein n=1 Tax=Thalassoporum mexicanum TaxID=3457544 RepID=UPI00029FC5E2|nr:tetratricopeptide repeat protein [Pseudanabaena sp. PCC 7367]AFY68567.1 Tetratricopeptide TPR_1 repeat-containing protein [Pseudanabaena sp. PCC 7367]